MSTGGSRLDDVAGVMRQTFDRAFAEPIASPAPMRDLLIVRVRNDRYAIVLTDIVGVHADRKIVPMPSSASDLLGIVGLRGAVVPIYDLGSLLGYPRIIEPRWVLIARAPTPVGFSFDQFEMHARVRADAFGERGGDAARGHLRGAVVVDGALHPMVDVASVVGAISRRMVNIRDSKG